MVIPQWRTGTKRARRRKHILPDARKIEIKLELLNRLCGWKALEKAGAKGREGIRCAEPEDGVFGCGVESIVVEAL